MNRLNFVFRKRYHCVYPALPGVGADLFGWITAEQNAVEAFRGDRRRYGLWIAVGNFVEVVVWRWKLYSEKQQHER